MDGSDVVCMATESLDRGTIKRWRGNGGRTIWCVTRFGGRIAPGHPHNHFSASLQQEAVLAEFEFVRAALQSDGVFAAAESLYGGTRNRVADVQLPRCR